MWGVWSWDPDEVGRASTQGVALHGVSESEQDEKVILQECFSPEDVTAQQGEEVVAKHGVSESELGEEGSMLS